MCSGSVWTDCSLKIGFYHFYFHLMLISIRTEENASNTVKARTLQWQHLRGVGCVTVETRSRRVQQGNFYQNLHFDNVLKPSQYFC